MFNNKGNTMSEVTVQDIVKAKEIARQNGYVVNLPTDKVEIAKNIATAAGYTVKEAPKPAAQETAPAAPAAQPAVDPVVQALKIATDAGYTIAKAPAAKPAAAPAATPAAPAANTTAAAQPAETQPAAPSQEDINYGWIEKAAASML